MIAVSQFTDFLLGRLHRLQDAQHARLSFEDSRMPGCGLHGEQPDFTVDCFEVTSVTADLKLLRQLAAVGRESFSADILHRLMFEIAQRRGWVADAEFRPEWLL